jgi:hypothetical protein
MNAAWTDTWPSVPFEAWQDTCTTLHLWTQVVGKVRLALAPMENHWWQVPLYLTSRGLTTSPMPFGARTIQIDFDFIAHRLLIAASDGARRDLPLAPCSVAEFYREIVGQLGALGIDVRIWTMPVEIADSIPFEADRDHATYEAEHANRFWRALVQADRVLKAFRSGYLGKVSPVHFFWGSFDLAVTRFSGRGATPHPGGAPNLGDWVMREAYSHELSSCGFWPGNGGFGRPAFYAYAYPEPPGFAQAAIQPEAAFYSRDLREFILPYDEVRRADTPDAYLLAFLQSTYQAAADRGKWDRLALERRAPGAAAAPAR